MERLRSAATVVGRSLLACSVLIASPAAAGTITVSNTLDNGPGSLRDAIANAISGDTISLQVSGEITLTSGPLVVHKDLTIVGPGAASLAISGGHSSRVLTIADVGAATVSITGVTISNGFADYGGGVLNGGHLTLTDAVLTGNNATFFGGGVYNAGVLSIDRGVVTNNYAEYRGGAAYAESGSTLAIAHTIVSGNSSSVGGAIDNHDGAVSIAASTFSVNSATGLHGGAGGAIHNGGFAGSVSISASTLAANVAAAEGGAVYMGSGVLTIVNSTVADNSSTCDSGGCGGGGGIYSNSATVSIGSSTLSNNTSLLGGSITSLYSTTTMGNSIVAKGGSGLNCYAYTLDGVVSGGNNVSDDTSCAAFFAQAGDLNDVAAGLDPAGLRDNGGPTQTIALLATSPAVDAVPLDACGDSGGVDQRGVVRPIGAGCDAGAFERERSPYTAQVQPPIHSDGSSVFKSNRGVVPVKFTLAYDGASTCQLVPATIALVRVAGAVGPINADVYSGSSDNGTNFRVDGCQYIYQLGTSSLGVGTYEVRIVIGANVVGRATFGLR